MINYRPYWYIFFLDPSRHTSCSCMSRKHLGSQSIGSRPAHGARPNCTWPLRGSVPPRTERGPRHAADPAIAEFIAHLRSVSHR